MKYWTFGGHLGNDTCSTPYVNRTGISLWPQQHLWSSVPQCNHLDEENPAIKSIIDHEPSLPHEYKPAQEAQMLVLVQSRPVWWHLFGQWEDFEAWDRDVSLVLSDKIQVLARSGKRSSNMEETKMHKKWNKETFGVVECQILRAYVCMCVCFNL